MSTWQGSRQRSEGSAITPVTASPQTVYRRLKRRLGRTLRRLHRKRPLVQVRHIPTHPGSPECHCRQTVPTQTVDSDRMVSPSGDFRPHLPEVAHTICSRPGSITNFPDLCLQFRIG